MQIEITKWEDFDEIFKPHYIPDEELTTGFSKAVFHHCEESNFTADTFNTLLWNIWQYSTRYKDLRTFFCSARFDICDGGKNFLNWAYENFVQVAQELDVYCDDNFKSIFIAIIDNATEETIAALIDIALDEITNNVEKTDLQERIGKLADRKTFLIYCYDNAVTILE